MTEYLIDYEIVTFSQVEQGWGTWGEVRHGKWLNVLINSNTKTYAESLYLSPVK